MSAALAEGKFVAAKPLPVQVDGERRLLKIGEEIPNPAEWGRSLWANLEAGNIIQIFPPDVKQLSDEQLLAEVKRRGITPKTTAKKG